MIEFSELIDFLDSIGGNGQTYFESYRICQVIKECNNMEGVFIEVGVDKGRTAQMIITKK